MSARRLDWGGVLIAFGALGLAAYVLWEAQRFTLLGSVFPRLVAVVLILAAAAVLVSVLLRRNRAAPGRSGSDARRLTLAVVLVGWVAAVPLVGFVVASMVGFAFVGLVAKYERWSARHWAGFGVTAIAAVGLLYLLFAVPLAVPFPAGVLFGG